MTIHVRIERLVLDDLPVPADGFAVAGAVESELKRLLHEQVPALLEHGGALPSLRAPAIALTPSAPAELGRRVGRATHDALVCTVRRP
jgi:hypothetical protein